MTSARTTYSGGELHERHHLQRGVGYLVPRSAYIVVSLLKGPERLSVSGAVGTSSPPGARVSDRDRLGHGEDLAGSRDEQGLRHAVGPSVSGKRG